jgi:hypothetical protein
MGSQKRIRVTFPTNIEGRLTHQIRNLGEDLYREIEVAGLGSIVGLAQVDEATDVLMITVLHTRKIAQVRALVTKLVARHLLSNRAQITFE